MLYNYYVFSHQTLGMCFYTLPAIILGIIMVVMGLVHTRNQKKREKDFEDEMEEKYGTSSSSSEAHQA